ncbi:MAG: HEAT repeat domain-containing protein [Sedimentisphaerales bacterium]|nr:HEAT repeat domain-containing protein [Sedimentisphaerales bacterium]
MDFRASKVAICVAVFVLIGCFVANGQKEGSTKLPLLDVYISTGDNHWLGDSLAVDSNSSLEAAFDMFKNTLGIRRLYWRGLQEAAWVNTAHVREENFRYATFHKWSRYLIKDIDLEKMVVKKGEKYGIEVWGVATLGDWGSPADTPGFNDFPFNSESKLRLEHPEWVPVDKYGYRRQGGTIELAYPQARKALVELHTHLAHEAGYKGVMFLTYVENFSMRFQDEFGYSEPIVKNFKKRYGIDIRKEDFTRGASKYDWYALRGEYVTKYLRELRDSLGQYGIKLGMFISPHRAHYPQSWATSPDIYSTVGRIYLDLETWVQEGIVDQLVVFGNCARVRQAKTVSDLIWLTRDTNTKVSFLTSGPDDPRWRDFQDKGCATVLTLGEDAGYFTRSTIAKQSETALKSGTTYEKMKFLSQVVEGKSQAASQNIVPLTKHENVIMRRLALLALSKLKDPKAIPAIEKGLFDTEVGVRCSAMKSLTGNHGPKSTAMILKAIDRDSNHPLCEMARNTLSRLKPVPRKELSEAALTHSNPMVRTTALRGLQFVATAEQIPVFEKALNDSCGYARYIAAMALGRMYNSPEAIEVLIKATEHKDVATADRAAVSLGETVKRGGDKIESLKPRILTTLKGLFAQMGDGCSRTDAEWGYRSVGNALLDFGNEGKKVLRQFMSQSKDKRLAELAWRVLYFREKAGQNKFNIISEKENDQAFKARPAWLKNIRVERIRQDFENEKIFGKEASGSVGNSAGVAARWSNFNKAKGPMSQSAIAHSGKKSIKLVRGGDGLSGWVDKAVPGDVDYEMQVWLYRGPQGSCALSAKDISRRESFAILIGQDGNLNIRHFDGETSWVSTKLSVPIEKWTKITVEAAQGTNSYSVSIQGKDGIEAKSQSEQLNLTSDIYMVSFRPQGPENTACYIDDIKLAEVR